MFGGSGWSYYVRNVLGRHQQHTAFGACLVPRHRQQQWGALATAAFTTTTQMGVAAFRGGTDAGATAAQAYHQHQHQHGSSSGLLVRNISLVADDNNDMAKERAARDATLTDSVSDMAGIAAVYVHCLNGDDETDTKATATAESILVEARSIVQHHSHFTDGDFGQPYHRPYIPGPLEHPCRSYIPMDDDSGMVWFALIERIQTLNDPARYPAISSLKRGVYVCTLCTYKCTGGNQTEFSIYKS